MAQRYMVSVPALLALALATPAVVAAAPAVYTPAPGSAERTAILKTLHAGDNRPQSRFTVKRFRAFRARGRTIAYVRASGPIGDFQAILERHAQGPWRKVWGEGDGGSNTCAAGARHYAWALRLVRTYTPQPDAIFPGLVARTDTLARMAMTDAEGDCVGDLDGGPK